MNITPKFRGFICTTAHPIGCAQNVRQYADYARSHSTGTGPKRVLVVGASAGYGLASRIAAAFGYGAATVGVSFDRPGGRGRTGSAGWYNNRAFEQYATQAGLPCRTVNGDGFSREVKEETIAAIRDVIPGGQVDLVVYSMAAPKRTDQDTNQTWSSVLKPLGQSFRGKTVDFHTGNVFETEIAPAEQEEAEGTIRVMGGEDWLLWMEELQKAGVLADNAAAMAYTYIGPELTHAIYRDGTIGAAKADLEQKACMITELLAPTGGHAFVAVLKGLVTQSSSAIPVVPLYISLLFKIMKEQGIHEGCIEQICRLYSQCLYSEGKETRGWSHVPVDESGRIRLDDWEMRRSVQEKIADLWETVDSDSIGAVADLEGYRQDFFQMFGFGVDGVDYNADVPEKEL